MNKTESQRIIDHAFIPPENSEDACNYERCGLPELAHEWTVNSRIANPQLGKG